MLADAYSLVGPSRASWHQLVRRPSWVRQRPSSFSLGAWSAPPAKTAKTEPCPRQRPSSFALGAWSASPARTGLCPLTRAGCTQLCSASPLLFAVSLFAFHCLRLTHVFSPGKFKKSCQTLYITLLVAFRGVQPPTLGVWHFLQQSSPEDNTWKTRVKKSL